MVAEVSSEKHLNNFTKLQICGSPSLETGNLSAHEGVTPSGSQGSKHFQWRKLSQNSTRLSDWRTNNKFADVGHKTRKDELRKESLNSSERVQQSIERNSSVREAGGGSSGSPSSASKRGNYFHSQLQQPRMSWVAQMFQHARSGRDREALRIYQELRERGVKPCSYTFVAALKACRSLQDLELGKQIHSDVVDSGFDSDVFVGATLVDMYAKCGSLVDARNVFDRMPQRDVVCWNAMILGYAQVHECEMALHLHSRMQQEAVIPNNRTFVAVLKACSSLVASAEKNEDHCIRMKARCLEEVRDIHFQIVRNGFEVDMFVGTMLVDVYSKCGSLVDARCVFDRMPRHDVVCWNAMILGYSQMDQGEVALQMYAQMQQEGVEANDGTFVGVLKACTCLTVPAEGIGTDRVLSRQQCVAQVRAIHSHIVLNGLNSDVCVGTMLVSAYAKCGSLVDARCVFDKMPHRDLVAWNAMILGHAQMEEGEEALQLYAQMQQEGIIPESRTFVAALKACGSLATVEEGRRVDGKLVKPRSLERVRAIHLDILKSKSHATDVFVGNSLLDVYAKCGSLEDARNVFDKMPHRDVISWTAMIFGYAQMEEGTTALTLFTQMQEADVVPNDRAIVAALKACSSLATSEDWTEFKGRRVKKQSLEQVRAIHLRVVNHVLESSVFVGTMLVDCYAKCGSLEEARFVFEKMPHKDVAAWNAIILSCAQLEETEEALELYARMQREGASPDDRTYVSVLKACGHMTAMEVGNPEKETLLKSLCLKRVREVHSRIAETRFSLDMFVQTMLVDVYSKRGSLAEARDVFEKMQCRDVVSWNAMILGYAQMDSGEVALELYARMQQDSIAPNDRTFVGALKACGGVAGLERGKEIHAQISKTGLETSDTYVASGLIDMYGKCGCMVEAQKVFDALPLRDIVAWNALIAGYGRQGECKRVFDLFERMTCEGLKPESITFVSVLTVCSHAGLLNEGQKFFEAMSNEFGVPPTIQHYTCMIDLLGRAGQLKKAMAMAQSMPFKADATVWEAILGACKKWNDVELGRQAFECAVRLNRNDGAAYVLMSNIYAAAHMWQDVKETQAMRLSVGAWKQPGQSRWTDMGGMVHVFGAGDREHPESQLIHVKVQELVARIKKAGYVPDLDSVLHDISDLEKEQALCRHSEKLAMAYALYKTPEGTMIRIVKNLRVCQDCHTATKWISKIEKRTIICRDASRFHVYSEGKCSCGDYW